MASDEQSDSPKPDTADAAAADATGADVAAAGAVTSTRRRRPGRVIGVVAGALALVLLGGYGAGYAISGDRTPRNATVSGVAIGGLSQTDAEALLQRQLGARAAAPISVTVDTETRQVDPATAGLTVDWAATVRASGAGRNADPRHIWRVLTGGAATAPVVEVDEARLTAAVAALAQQVDRQPADATVKVVDNKVVATPAVTGRTLDRAGSVKALRESYFVQPAVMLPVAVAEPAITDAKAAEAKAFAEKLVSGPITLNLAGGATYQVPVATLAKSYGFVVENGALVPKLDGKVLYELNKAGLDKLPVTQPKNAKVEIRDGKPYVVPAVDGVKIDEAALSKAVQEAVAKTGRDRKAAVTPNGAKAEHTTADAQKAGVKEIVSEYTTQFPYAEYRNVNLTVAAGLMNNTYLRPGEQFSLNGEIGPRSASQGFIDGYFIEGGILKKGLAGGISQSATTVFNAAFFAGLKIDQHQPHTLYFPRYPAGRESTVYYPSIDVKFTNDTPYGVVVQAFVNKASAGRQGSITVRIWSTKYYTVESPDATRSDYYRGTTRYVQDPNCEYQAPIQGFTAKYYRIVRKLDGTVAKRENYTWKYSAGDEIKCGKPPAPKPPTTPTTPKP